jgi:hypothetical protein
MITIEQCVEHVDAIAQDVVNRWAMWTKAGHNEALTPEFNEVLELAFQYRDAKELADNRREFNVLSEKVTAREAAKREAFAQAYKQYSDRNNIH